MSLTGRWIDLVFKVATGDWKIRLLLAPVVGGLYLAFVISLVFFSLVFDRFFGIPAICSTLSKIAGIALVIAGLTLTVISIGYFVRARGTPVPLCPPVRLVTTGPYRFARNPMFTGIFAQLAGLGVAMGSATLTFIFTPLFIAVNVWELRKVEEPELEKRLGEEYVRYKRQVPMFFPWLKRHV